MACPSHSHFFKPVLSLTNSKTTLWIASNVENLKRKVTHSQTFTIEPCNSPTQQLIIVCENTPLQNGLKK